jgi:hypothetical protein
MKIVKLPVGEQAPKDSDCISLQHLPDGTVRLEASALMSCGDGDEAESVALVDGGAYRTIEEAEAAGMAWAEGHCVEQLYVSTDA